MTDNFRDDDALLDRAAAQIAAAEPSAEQVRQAADRVWAQLTADGAQVAASAAAVEQIRGCDDYQALIPAYLAGQLPQARRLLVEDHTRECVPCHRALKAAREGKPLAAHTATAPAAAPTPRRHGWVRWAVAAALVAGIGVAQMVIREVMPLAGASARVARVDGDLFRVATDSHLPMAVGEELREGQTVRTGRTGGAVIELRDGSRVELRERSEVAIDEGRRGTTIELARGSVIVQAAKQRDRHLYVSTDDCLVSVTGTIFSVNHGTKGSRVSVIEGEVRVDYAGDQAVLTPGNQVATSAALGTLPIDQEIAWSRDVDHYLALLGEFSSLRHELQAVPRPELRYSSRILDLMPDGTVFYGAFPNLGETITGTRRVLRERLAASPALAEWWQAQGSERFEPQVDEIIDRLGELGEYLGEELVVAGQGGGEDFQGPLVVAEVRNPAGVRALVEQMASRDGDGDVTFVDDPAALPAAGDGDQLFLWLADSLVVASPLPEQIRGVAAVLEGAPNPFTETPFYQTVAELYVEGADILVAADLETLVERVDPSAEDAERLDQLGFADARYLVFEQKHAGNTTQHRAVLSFRDERRGVASWLAAPAPMGSLGFISPDAKIVAAFVFKDPAKMLDDLEAVSGGKLHDFLGVFEQRHGVDLRDDFAATLGGELAFAVDGPLLPKPAWKLVLEVYDLARFQWVVEEAVNEVNVYLAQQGLPAIAIEEQTVGGRTFYSLPTEAGAVSYTFVEGYLVMAPSPALLDQAIRFRSSGYAITDAPRFTALLPADSRNNFSALVYHDLGSVMQAVAEQIAAAQEGSLTPEQQQTLDALKAESRPTLGYAYGEDDRIVIAASSEGDLLTSLLTRAMGLKDPAGIEQMLEGLGR